MPAFREFCICVADLRGRPTVAYDQQGLVFAVAMGGYAIKLFDSRSYDKGPFDTFLVGGDTAEKCGFNMDSSQNATIEATFTPDAQYVLSGSGDGNIHAWDIRNEPPNKVASMDSHIGVPSCLKWAPQRVAFAATVASVLTLRIPNDEANNPDAKPKPAPDFIHGCFILSPYVS